MSISVYDASIAANYYVLYRLDVGEDMGTKTRDTLHKQFPEKRICINYCSEVNADKHSPDMGDDELNCLLTSSSPATSKSHDT